MNSLAKGAVPFGVKQSLDLTLITDTFISCISTFMHIEGFDITFILDISFN